MSSPPIGSRPIRVMLVSGSFPPMRCGVGDYTARLADELASRCGERRQ